MRRGVLSGGPVRVLIVLVGIGLVGLIQVRDAPAQIPGSATLAASPSHVTFGEEVSFTGRVEAGSDCSAGRAVDLLRRRAGSDTWEPVGSTTSDRDGAFTLAESPSNTAEYEAFLPATDG